MKGHVKRRGDRYYAVIYEGRDAVQCSTRCRCRSGHCPEPTPTPSTSRAATSARSTASATKTCPRTAKRSAATSAMASAPTSGTRPAATGCAFVLETGLPLPLPMPETVKAPLAGALGHPLRILRFGASPAAVREQWGMRWSPLHQLQYATASRRSGPSRSRYRTGSACSRPRGKHSRAESTPELPNHTTGTGPKIVIEPSGASFVRQVGRMAGG